MRGFEWEQPCIRDEDTILGVDSYIPWIIKLSGLRTLLSELHDKGT